MTARNPALGHEGNGLGQLERLLLGGLVLLILTVMVIALISPMTKQLTSESITGTTGSVAVEKEGVTIVITDVTLNKTTSTRCKPSGKIQFFMDGENITNHPTKWEMEPGNCNMQSLSTRLKKMLSEAAPLGIPINEIRKYFIREILRELFY